MKGEDIISTKLIPAQYFFFKWPSLEGGWLLQDFQVRGDEDFWYSVFFTSRKLWSFLGKIFLVRNMTNYYFTHTFGAREKLAFTCTVFSQDKILRSVRTDFLPDGGGEDNSHTQKLMICVHFAGPSHCASRRVIVLGCVEEQKTWTWFTGINFRASVSFCGLTDKRLLRAVPSARLLAGCDSEPLWILKVLLFENFLEWSTGQAVNYVQKWRNGWKERRQWRCNNEIRTVNCPYWAFLISCGLASPVL